MAIVNSSSENPRIGLTVGLGPGPLSDSMGLVDQAISSGYTDFWSAEVGGADGFAPLAAVAARNGGARLGTAIVPIFTRPPALLAMSAATMQNLAPGRFVLGIGTSSDIIVRNWMGASFDMPITRMRETIEVLREALAGSKVSYEGKTLSVKGFRLEIDSSTPTPIYVAALGPKACRLAGEVADGVIFFLKTPDGVRQSLEWVAEGAKAAGRDPAELDCVQRITVAMNEDPETLAFMGKRLITTYAMVDVYNRSLAQQGFAEQARAIREAWTAGERDKAAAQVTDEMLNELNVFGDSDECRKKIDQFRDAGVRTPVVLPISVAGDPAERKEKMAEVVGALAPKDRS